MSIKRRVSAYLVHKAESYTTRDCIVEKTINVSHQYFEKIKNNTLADDFFVKANKDLMYQDENTAHCLMFLDYTTGDGLLTESEGADYARKSQFIPNAKAIIQQSEITGSEKELHRRLEEIVNSMSENSHKGENH